MTRLLTRHLMIPWMLLMLGCMVTACDAGGAPAPSPAAAATQLPTPTAVALTPTPASAAAPATSQPPTPTAIAPTSTPAPLATPAPTQSPAAVGGAVTVAFGAGPFDITDTARGLADLSGYKATLTLSFDGTQAGQAKKWSTTYVMLTRQVPPARQLTVAKTGAVSDTAQPVMLAEMDGAVYERDGASPCIANAIRTGDSQTQRMEPAAFLSVVLGAETAGSEAVNGVAADYYKFDERALGQVGLAKATGELWVASKGGYLVRYLLTAKGGAAYFGDGSDGTLSWDYELTGANQPPAIKLPADCPAGMVDVPRLPGAVNVLSVPGLLAYDTPAGLADAAAFYQKQLPALGWKVDGEPAVSDASQFLQFTQPAKTLSVVLTTGKAGTRVRISLGK